VFAIAGWQPVDVTSSGDWAYFLDGKGGRIYAFRAGTDELTLAFEPPESFEARDRWTRVLVDREGRYYLLNPAAPRLEIFDRDGQPLGNVRDADDVRDRFPAPPIRMDRKGRFKLPADLARQCGVAAGIADLVFDRQGRAVRIPNDEPAGPRPYSQSGLWISKELDSKIPKCQWHRVEMEIGDLPPGTVVAVSTWTSEIPLSTQDVLATAEWKGPYRAVGPMQPGVSSTRKTHEFLVTSDGAQFLWLKLELSGDGYGSPAIRSLRVHYPRESYLEYLPAVYQAEEDSRRFLERFLSIAQSEWDPLETSISEISRYFDPRTVPEGPFLDYLARWLALPLEGSWTYPQKRHLLRAAPEFTGRAGTLEGMQQYLRAYLEAMREDFSEESDPEAYPRIVEGFRERDRLMLSVGELAQLGFGAPLWSPSVVARLQLGVFAREGEARMVSTGDPERDLFHEFSHRFRVFVPSVWVHTGEDERMIRRAVEAVKPSQTAYELCLVEPRFRIALQSTVGVDTILGAYPRARLACTHEDDPPPSRPPRYRLGYDTILAAEPAGASFGMTPGLRVGLETNLT
jgi:phage tail-like protein